MIKIRLISFIIIMIIALSPIGFLRYLDNDDSKSDGFDVIYSVEGHLVNYTAYDRYAFEGNFSDGDILRIQWQFFDIDTARPSIYTSIGWKSPIVKIIYIYQEVWTLFNGTIEFTINRDGEYFIPLAFTTLAFLTFGVILGEYYYEYNLSVKWV